MTLQELSPAGGGSLEGPRLERKRIYLATVLADTLKPRLGSALKYFERELADGLRKWPCASAFTI
jgi:hypothetical protein